jgi:hypothetical protein
VTVAAGFRCQDGIVLCADTQESILSYTKSSTQKLQTWELDDITISFAGAGDALLDDMIAQETVGAIVMQKPKDWDGFKRVFNGVMLKIVKKHLIPLAAFKNEQRPSADMLIAVQFQDGALLFKSRDTLMRVVYGAECVGSGELLFQSFRDRLYSPSFNLAVTSKLAIYILNQIKRHVDGCGGNTDIALLNNKGRKLARISTDEVEKLEQDFNKFDEATKLLLFSFPDSSLTSEQFEKTMTNFRLDMATLRYTSMDEYFQKLQEITGMDLGIKIAEAFSGGITEKDSPAK